VRRLLELAVAAVLVGVGAACGDSDEPGSSASGAEVRAARRAYAGAPPVIPHAPFGAGCTACHTERGMDVDGIGFAPPSPHDGTDGMAGAVHCNQCHVFQATDGVFRANAFEGLAWRPAHRAYDGAPPVMPHPVFMHEDCLACHAGPAAREAIRTTHPERENCRQCHLSVAVAATFER